MKTKCFYKKVLKQTNEFSINQMQFRNKKKQKESKSNTKVLLQQKLSYLL